MKRRRVNLVAGTRWMPIAQGQSVSERMSSTGKRKKYAKMGQGMINLCMENPGRQFTYLLQICIKARKEIQPLTDE